MEEVLLLLGGKEIELFLLRKEITNLKSKIESLTSFASLEKVAPSE